MEAIAPDNTKPGLKLSLNAYSFNDQLLKGTMSISDMLQFCADHALVAADITAYYFPDTLSFLQTTFCMR
jgi:hypothetical protein